MALAIRVLEAVLLYSHENKMLPVVEPYCVVTVGPESISTHALKGAKTHLIWDQLLEFKRKSTHLKVAVKDDIAYSDDEFASGSMEIAAIYQQPNDRIVCNQPIKLVPIEIYHRNNCAGKVIVEAQYKLDTGE